jgi:acetylornithine/N-succinyldiaminopimelate aminotransferase
MLAATDKELFREGFGPMPAGFVHVPFGNLNALRDIMADDVAAIMVEPVQGEGGARAAPEGYLDGLANAAQEFGALVIADEVQCGLGRTGKFFAFQHSSIQPDIVVLAKGLGGGIPIGAVIARADIGEAMGPGSHGSTFGGNPLSTACGNAVLDGLEEEGFMAGVQHRISLLDDVVSRLHSRFFDIILEVRGAGFLRGMKLHDNILAGDVTAALRERHLLVVPAADNVVRLLPPLTITEDEIAQVEAHFKACFDRLSASK